jgi:hypothetical protein
MESREISISNAEKTYIILDFGKYPTNIKNIIVDLGSVRINDKEVRLPPLEFRRTKHRRYVPFFLGV